MNKAKSKTVVERDVSRSIEQVVLATKNHLKIKKPKDPDQAKSEIEQFLKKQSLQQVTVTCRSDSHQVSNFYIRFSFDGSIIENATIRQKI